jgi:GNAT superfamily N-acetyltransferase
MTIRPAVDQDIPSIVELLKISLGESLMPKSEAFWRWKHIDNPFGRSPVLLAFESNRLIGVRAFMRWEWKQGGKIYKAVRAVDTATHPDHQGKGIFKKLTLQLVEQCKTENIDFIFNTPNSSSKPGYLKMGWMSNGKMRLRIWPVIPWKTKRLDFDSSYLIGKRDLTFKNEVTQPTLLTTMRIDKFLNWRYRDNPNIPYYFFSDEESSPSYRVIFRLKPHRFGIEFRVCETLFQHTGNITGYKKHLKEVIQASGANIISSVSHEKSISLPIGPEITTYPLSFDHNFLTFNFWKPALGDLEVF